MLRRYPASWAGWQGKAHRFQMRHSERKINLWAVRGHCRYSISYRELEEMLAGPGVSVDHTTLYRWVQRDALEIEKQLRWAWRHPGHSWWA